MSVHAPVELGDLVNDHIHWQLIAVCSGVLAKNGGRVRDQFLLGIAIESASSVLATACGVVHGLSNAWIHHINDGIDPSFGVNKRYDGV